MKYDPRRILNKNSNQLMVTVKDVMTKKFVFVDPDESIDNAIEKILKSNQTGAPALDRSLRPVGFLSQKDCLKLATDMRYFNSISGTVNEYMSNSVRVLGDRQSLLKRSNHSSITGITLIPSRIRKMK